jgi:hypothetical protein
MQYRYTSAMRLVDKCLLRKRNDRISPEALKEKFEEVLLN